MESKFLFYIHFLSFRPTVPIRAAICGLPESAMCSGGFKQGGAGRPPLKTQALTHMCAVSFQLQLPFHTLSCFIHTGITNFIYNKWKSTQAFTQKLGHIFAFCCCYGSRTANIPFHDTNDHILNHVTLS